MALALLSDPDGFIMTVVVSIVAATMGPISIPLMLGLLPWFKRHRTRRRHHLVGGRTLGVGVPVLGRGGRLGGRCTVGAARC